MQKTVKPAQRRPSRKVAPLTEKDVLFCHFIMKGLPDPKATQLERIETVGAEGWLFKSRSEPRLPPQVQAYLEKYRDRLIMQMVKEEVRGLKRQGFMRDDVLSALYDIATLPPEKTTRVCTRTQRWLSLDLTGSQKNITPAFAGVIAVHLEVRGS